MFMYGVISVMVVFGYIGGLNKGSYTHVALTLKEDAPLPFRVCLDTLIISVATRHLILVCSIISSSLDTRIQNYHLEYSNVLHEF